MKTDRFDRQDVFTIATIEDARKYINCEGYFSDSLFTDLNEWRRGILKEVDEDAMNFPFLSLDTKYGFLIYAFRLFIPLEKVKEVEKLKKCKKWRAFKSIDEFANTLGLYPVLGNEVIYRRKNNPFGIARAAITRTYVDSKSGSIRVTFGDENIGFDFLFGQFEWKDENGNWQPFGVVSDENA